MNLLKEKIKYLKCIKNTLEYADSNGVMKRNNNTCNLIKRISFGFKKFRNMKSRIMIITNMFRKDKRECHVKSVSPNMYNELILGLFQFEEPLKTSKI